MRVVEIAHDMDHAGVTALRSRFDELACSTEDVRIDLSHVHFLDSAGLCELVSLSRALRRRSLEVSLVHASGQPLRMLRQSLMAA